MPQLLEKVVQSGQRAVVLAASEDRIEVLANLLWTYTPDSWLPHGSVKDGFSEDQPVWLTTREENPNGARILVLTDGMISTQLTAFDRCLDMFDGTNPESTAAARERWSAAKTAGHVLHYWQQTETGWQERNG